MPSGHACPETPAILLVDDDPDIRHALGDALEHDGYRVESVGFGREAIERAGRRVFGAAVLDMGLPDLDGQTVLDGLVEMDPALPIIVLTGHPSQEGRVGSLTRGAFAYVAKPYILDELRATLRRAVGIKQLAVKAETVESALSESEDRFRSVVESATDAIVIADGQGRIHSWNRAAASMFGYEDREVLGQPLTLLMPERYRQAHRRGIERLGSTRETRLTGKILELEGLRKDGVEFPLELSLGTWQAKGEVFLSGILRDITGRRRIERRLAAQYAVSNILSGSGPLERAVRDIIQTVCESLEWTLGTLWVADLREDHLRCLEMWPSDHARLADFIQASRETTFPRGVGLPGRVWNSGEAAWDLDEVGESDIPRSAIAARKGLHGACAFPVLIDGQAAGVMEFFAQDLNPPDQDLMKMMATVGSQLGRFLDRVRHEERLAKINQCTLSFGNEARANIASLVNLCGDLLGGHHALYNRLEGQSLHAAAGWKTPPDLIPIGRAQGHICFDVITAGSLEPTVVRHLQASPYAETDSMVLPYRLQTYLGQAVRCHGHPVGSLCLLYQKDVLPNEGDRRVLSLLASAIGVEEERQQGEEALRHAYDETERILAGLPCAIVISHQDQRVAYTNALARQYFGSDRVTGIGRPVTDFLPLSSDRWAAINHTAAASSRSARASVEDGKFDLGSRKYGYRAFPVALRGSGQLQTGLVIWDVTEQQQLLDQLIQAEKLASLGTLVFGMAHEINNPIQGILGMAEIILAEEDPAKIREYAQDIVNFSSHVGSVVRNFSAYARPATREGSVEIDVNERIAEAIKLVQRCPQFGRVEIVTDFRPLPSLEARRAEVDQIFVNLISNAVEAMEGKGRLTVATWTEGDGFTASVMDTGPGIPAHVLTKIFDPFFTTKAPGKGTGLGLSVVYQIVHKYGGSIRAESLDGQGTTFIVHFPESRKETRHDHAGI